MAYTFDQIFAADPSSPANVAQNAAVTIYAPGDSTMAPLTITTTDGAPLANPVVVNSSGFGPAFIAAVDRVAWSGGGFSAFFTSYEGMKAEAVDARTAAQDAQSAAADSALSAKASAGLVTAPADDAIAAAVNGTDTATRTALDARYTKSADYAAGTAGKVSKGETVIKVADYMASAANHAAAIQAAIDAAYASDAKTKIVQFDPITYETKGARIRLRGGLTYRASGATFTKSSTAAGYAVFFTGSDGNKGYGSGDSNWTFEGGTFLGNFAASIAVCGFALHHSDNFKIIGAKFSQAVISAHAIDMLGCSRGIIDSVTFEGMNPQGGGYNKEEAIQCDASAADSSSAPDLPGSYDGLGCKDIEVRNSRFLPITVGGTTYPAPNPFGSHALYESGLSRRIRFINNYTLDAVVDSTSDMRGSVHFAGVDGLKIADNVWEYSTPQNTQVIGLYSTDLGTPAAGANYEIGGSSALSTIPVPLVCRNVEIDNNRFKGFANVNGATGRGNITVEPLSGGSNIKADNISITNNQFEMLNTAASTPNSIYIRYATNVLIGAKNLFTGPTRPLDLGFIDDLFIGANFATSPRADAFRVTDSNRVTYDGVHAKACAGTGLYAINLTRLKIRGCNVDSLAGSRAVAINAVNGFIVTNNDVKAPAGTKGIEAYGASSNGKVNTNIIGGGTTTHVDITGATATTQQDNLALAA